MNFFYIQNFFLPATVNLALNDFINGAISKLCKTVLKSSKWD